MNLPKSLASSQAHSQPMKHRTWLALNQLTPSEIASLQQSKKSIADYVQRELSERMKQRHLEHMVPKV